MNRKKRNIHQRAYKLGYQQGIKGHSKNLCPYQTSLQRNDWVVGWQLGHHEFATGDRLQMMDT